MQDGSNRNTNRNANRNTGKNSEQPRDTAGTRAATPDRGAASASSPRAAGRASRKRPLDRREASLQRRLKAAGLDGPTPQDKEELRRRMLRHLYIFMDRSHGCREPLCRRYRGCMAPNLVCSNLPQLTKEEDEKLERDWPRTAALLQKLIKARLAAEFDAEKKQ